MYVTPLISIKAVKNVSAEPIGSFKSPFLAFNRDCVAILKLHSEFDRARFEPAKLQSEKLLLR